MQSNSKGKMFGTLYKNELHKLLPEILIMVGVTLVIDLVLYFKVAGAVAVMPSLILIGMVFLLPFLTSFKVLYQEWSNQTIYLLLSLPASGGMVLGAKLAALFSQLLIGSLAVAVCGGLLFWAKVTPEQIQYLNNLWLTDPRISLLWKWVVFLFLVSLTAMLFLICSSFLSQVVGKLSRKFSGVVTVVTFLVILYLNGKLFYLMPALNVNDPVGGSFYLAGGYLLLNLLVAAVIFAVAAVLYDRKLEL